ncbi:unnamed protein product, partial [Meganyctiphanes norvegica]
DCPPTFEIIAHQCLQINTKEKMNRNQAMQYCQQKGGELVTPIDMDLFVKSLVDRGYVHLENAMWIGGQFNFEENAMLWPDGTKVKEDECNFNLNGPGNCLKYSQSEVLLETCSEELMFICEIRFIEK